MKHLFMMTAVFAAFWSFAAEINLVKEGSANVSIVLPDDAIQSDRFAAEEFSKWLYEASKVKVEFDNAPKANLIPIKFVHTDKDVQHDGFAITASNQEIVISANKPIGILFGVYYILNRWCGVYWCNPDSGADFEKRKSFSIPSGRIVKNPMAVREGVPSGNGALATPERREAVALWNVRNGFNLRSRPRGADLEKTQPGNYYPNHLMLKLGDEGDASTGGHVLGELVLESPVDRQELAEELKWTKENAKKLFENSITTDKISKYARWRVLVKHHPEWFGLVDGKRVPTGVSLRERTEIKGKSSMPCLSNPDVRELLLRNLRLRHDKICKGKPIVFRLCCDDQSQWCECDECMKLLKCKGSCDDKDKASDYWWDFINWMSERLLSDPLVSVNVCVYRTYQTYPKRVKPIARDRMRIILCPHGRCYLHSLTDPKCKSNAKYKAMFDEWAREGMPILAFEYTNQTPGKCNYAFWERAWVQDLKWYAKHGISQGAGGLIGPWDAYSTDDGYFRRNATKARWQIGWLTGHFEWDSEDDFDDVRNRLFKIYYRKAAAKMIEYRSLLEKAIYATGQCMCYGSGGTLFSSAAFQPGVLSNAKCLLNESMALAKGDSELQRRIAADAEWFHTNWESAGISADAAIEMTRTKVAPTIDGRLDEMFWRTASPVDDFRKIVIIRDTPKKPKERYAPATTLKFAFDDNNLYIGCICDKAGGKVNDIPATGAVFDAMKGSHMEFFFLAPSLGGKYYHIAISHNGKKYSAFTENGKTRDLKRPLPFNHAITDEQTKWTLEISIPLSALGGAKPGDLWKIDASRIAVDANGKPIRGYGSLCGFGMHSTEYWKTFSFGAPSNLLSNGSFEELAPPPEKKEGDQGLNGRGWTFVSKEVPTKWFYQQNGGIAEAVEDGAAEGKRFLRLKSPKRGLNCFLWQDIQAYPGGTEKITFSFKARGKGSLTARLMQHPKQTEKFVTKIDTPEWKEYSGVFTLGELHPSRFMINVGSLGLDIDDLVLSISDKTKEELETQDSTSKLQAALNEGGKVVIKREGSPWFVRPLQVKSNTEIFFEDGAILCAATNAYFNHNDSVLNLIGSTNVTIRGRGIVKMNKFEYRQLEKGYKPGDGRHCVRMRGVKNVLIEDVTFRDAGADGVYVTGLGWYNPASRNVTLRRVTCDGSFRQGVSVISVNGFLAEDCCFMNTKGTSPEAGLDFEPNYHWEQLANCKVHRCIFKNNAGTGLHVSPHWLEDGSMPVTITISDCEIRDSGYCGLEFMRNGPGMPPKGSCLVENTLISGTTTHGIVFARKFANMFNVTLRNVTIERSGLKNQAASDIYANSRYWDDDPPGGIEMDNVVIYQTRDRQWFKYEQQGLGVHFASKWKGAVRLISPSGEKTIKLDKNWVESTFNPPAVKKIARKQAPDYANAKVVDRYPDQMRELEPFHSVTPNWVFYVDRPKVCKFRMRQVAWGSKKCRPSPHMVRIFSLSSKTKGEWSVPQPKEKSEIVEFEAKEPGFYEFKPVTESTKIFLEAANVPVAWNLASTGGHSTGQGRSFCASEKAALWIAPCEGEDFSFVVGGKDQGVNMALYSPSGNVVWQAPKVTTWNIFNGTANENGLWKLDLSAPEIARYKQGYSFVINMMGTPAHFFLDKDRYWTFPKPKKPLKVLMVGNSFSICALHETPKICAEMKLPLDLCSLFIGGCPLSKHASNLSSNKVPYVIKWNYCGQTDKYAIPFANILEERLDPKAGSILRKMLSADRWDIVTIQQASHESWKVESYEPYGSELIKAIRQHAPQAKILVQQTWSYTPLAPRLNLWNLTYETMFEKVSAAYDAFAKSHNLDLIRMGSAIDRYRKERPVKFEPNTPCQDDVVGNNIKVTKKPSGDLVVTGDSIHLNPIGEFFQGLVWTAKLFNVDVTRSTYVPANMVSLPAKDVQLMRKIAGELR